MTSLIPSINQNVLTHRNISLSEAKSLKDESIWSNLKTITLEQGINHWLTTLTHLTRLNYQSAFGKLIERGLLNPFISLQEFALTNGDGVVDPIKQITD